ncbi:methyl-accepting chemotaxis protein [Amaricoccus macauensis]|uniref:methyl-accepting chemotaxis protein n=1 Tax=Amaricoccus macauensis TaxID=57001 RepID=UPI003C7C4883
MQAQRQGDSILGQDDGLSHLASEASSLGYEVVDIAGFIDDVEVIAAEQLLVLETVRQAAGRVIEGNGAVQTAVRSVSKNTSETLGAVEHSVEYVRRAGQRSQEVATWVAALTERMEAVANTLDAIKSNNSDIARIASQVNILAINAKIEAARAGDAGRGFAVVADAINELSRQTSGAAESTTRNVSQLAGWIGTLHDESAKISDEARSVIEESHETDTALVRIADSVRGTHDEARHITEEAEKVNDATNIFAPAFEQIGDGIERTATGIGEARGRVHGLIDASERILQGTVALGGSTEDAPFIDRVMEDANRVGGMFTEAIRAGQITAEQLFSRQLQPIPNTDPQQHTAPFNGLLDRLLPQVQEGMLEFDPKVVFCAAVNIDGYLSTHNRKFSQTPGSDPAWNAANCRNRRIFDDRVGLKAGRNTGPFLLQVYRRDMGGGQFAMMKDLSAPIMVDRRHWGGLRVGYKF